MFEVVLRGNPNLGKPHPTFLPSKPAQAWSSGTQFLGRSGRQVHDRDLDQAPIASMATGATCKPAAL